MKLSSHWEVKKMHNKNVLFIETNGSKRQNGMTNVNEPDQTILKGITNALHLSIDFQRFNH